MMMMMMMMIIRLAVVQAGHVNDLKTCLKKNKQNDAGVIFVYGNMI